MTAAARKKLSTIPLVASADELVRFGRVVDHSPRLPIGVGAEGAAFEWDWNKRATAIVTGEVLEDRTAVLVQFALAAFSRKHHVRALTLRPDGIPAALQRMPIPSAASDLGVIFALTALLAEIDDRAKAGLDPDDDQRIIVLAEGLPDAVLPGPFDPHEWDDTGFSIDRRLHTRRLLGAVIEHGPAVGVHLVLSTRSGLIGKAFEPQAGRIVVGPLTWKLRPGVNKMNPFEAIVDTVEAAEPGLVGLIDPEGGPLRYLRIPVATPNGTMHTYEAL